VTEIRMTNEILKLEIRTSDSGVAAFMGYLDFGIPLAFVIRASTFSNLTQRSSLSLLDTELVLC